MKNVVKKSAYAALVVASMVAVPVIANAQNGGYLMTEAEKEAVRNVIKEYISDNGEFLFKVMEETAQKQAQQEAKENQYVKEVPEGLYDSKTSPIAGNPNGDVTIVEFFDYNCGYCKRVVGDLNRLIEEDKNVKVIFKELPILSDSSQVAARFALAANMQGADKYMALHTALMKASGRPDEKEILRLADSVQIDIGKLNEDVYNTDIGDELTANVELARELGVRGTPFFIIGDEKVPGAINYARIKTMVEAARLNAKRNASKSE